MGTDVAFSFLGTLAERLVDPIVRQFSYLFFYNSNTENLVQELKRLQAARDGAKHQVLAAGCNLETIDPAMQLWLEGVDEMERKAIIVIERKFKVEQMCLNLGSSLNVKQRYLLSRKATKLIIGIGILKSDGDKYAKSTHSASPPGIVADDALLPKLQTRITNSQSIPNYEGFESRKLIVEQVMEALKNDGIRMIGICGLGGVGKTTMANDVCKTAKAQGLFEQFAMTSVSQMQDLHKIQRELAGMLGLKFNDNDDSIFLRAQRLLARLSNGQKILVILDDVWQELSLQEVGIPTDCMRCKVIFTSRSKDVVRDMGTHKIFDVGVLTETESWELFEANIGNFDDTNDRNATAKKIVKKCGGLPIAIVTLAKALKDKEKHVWDNALHHLEQSTGEKIHGMAEHVYRCIEWSYESVRDSGARALLLICCLRPEDASTSIDKYLVRFKDSPVLEEVTEDGVRTLVGDLISNNLLVSGHRSWVKVHDIVREVCLSIEGLNKLGRDREPSIGMANRSIVSRKPSFYEELGSQAFKQVIEALADDQISIIVMVGDGLSLLVNEVIEKVKEDNLFDDVAVIFKCEIDLFKMQGVVARKLGLACVKEGTSITERAKQIRARLTDGTRRRLIILHDAWIREIDLEKVGIPVGAEHNKECKVAIVTDDKNRYSFIGSKKMVIVDPLSNEQGLVLFREHAGRFDEELDPIAKQIVEKCDGHAPTIIRYGEALKNQNKNVWLHHLHGYVYNSFEFFYNSLSSRQAQILWLLGRAMIEDSGVDIPIEKLVVASERLKLFKDVKEGDLEAVRNKVFDLLQHLHNRSFLRIDVNDNSVSLYAN